jgi:hypothetical protein
LGRQDCPTVEIDYYNPSRDYRIDLGDRFSGDLYLAFNFTHGNLGYAISAPSSGVSAVQLPAGVLRIASRVAALGAAGLRRQRGAA